MIHGSPTHLIRFKEEYSVEWNSSSPDEDPSGRLKVRYMPGDIVSCNIHPDGPGHQDFDFPCSEVTIAGFLDLWNVPDSVYEVLIGETPEKMRILQKANED
jgi:hypothetical protein